MVRPPSAARVAAAASPTAGRTNAYRAMLLKNYHDTTVRDAPRIDKPRPAGRALCAPAFQKTLRPA